MNRLHVVGGKNHGKTSLVVELVQLFSAQGLQVGTIKHTHHHHELDVPGKDSYRHRKSGAQAAGIISPLLDAIYLPREEQSLDREDRYNCFAPAFSQCSLVLVEGDLQTTAVKIEVWRKELGTSPICRRDNSILALVTDATPSESTPPILLRSDLSQLAEWIQKRCLT